MAKSILMLVDEDGDELKFIADILGKRYGADYDVIAEKSAKKALKKLDTLKDDDAQVALIFADLWMPEMTGIEFLKQAADLHPSAKRIPLITWGDREARLPILQATTFGWIDNYVGKPMNDPDERFHRVISELLDDWCRECQLGAVLLQIVDDRSSKRSRQLRDLLNRYGISFRFYDTASEQGTAICEQVERAEGPYPVIVTFDGRVFTNPTNDELAEALAVNLDPEIGELDVIIIGAGPAGLSAAVYGASEGLQLLVIERESIGGQAGTSPLIRNYLGFPLGVSGAELASKAYNQAWLFGAQFYLLHEVKNISMKGQNKIVTLTDGTKLESRVVVLAMGVTYRRLGIDNLEKLVGRGVFYGSTVTEAQATDGQHVFVAGAGNSAGQTAVQLSRYAEQVTLVVRGASLGAKMSDYLVKEIEGIANIEVCLETEIVDGSGRRRLEKLTLQNTKTGEKHDCEATALFVQIGADPHTEWLPKDILRDKDGYILTGIDLTEKHSAGSKKRTPMRLETSMPGVFAVGDARYRSVKRVASAVGEGGAVISAVHEYLSANPD